MPTPNANPYAAPAEDSQPIARPRRIREGRLASTSFALALGAPPLSVVCAAAGINLGLWDMIFRVIPMPFSLLLYLAISWMGVLLPVVGLAAALVSILSGRWWQRLIVVGGMICYIWFAPYLLNALVSD